MVLGKQKSITMTTVSILCLEWLLLSALVVTSTTTTEAPTTTTTTETPTPITAAPLPSENEAPTISIVSGNNRINAQVNSSIEMVFTGQDDKTFVYDIINQPVAGFIADNSTGNLSLIWTPTNVNTERIRVTAQDSDGLTAEAIEIEITLCSGCNNQGSCDYNNTRNQTSNYFKLAYCICDTGYSGDDCETDTNACADNPCALGRDCSDLTPAEEVRLGRTYNCSSCPAGYTITADEKCDDIDECLSSSTNNCPANSNCTNTDGSYTCTCLSGFRKVGSLCRDIDECAELFSGCQQTCDNNDGGFTCGCGYGYELLTDGKTCNQTIKDICQLQRLNCSYACDNTTRPFGEWGCICEEGYKLEGDSSTCTNINECDSNVCTQSCNDTIGSYFCSCFNGFKLNADKTTCTECSPPYYGNNCEQLCTCGPGAISCDSSRGCVCSSSWEGDNCDVDVNECLVTPDICGSDKTCVNTNGGYECNCRSGYQKTSIDNSVPCTDINECNVQSLNNCTTTTSTCQNTGGGYTCKCKSGYQQKNTYECEDINECTTGSNDCEQDCVNFDGRYNCKCKFGFELNTDRKTCKQVSDPCGTLSNLTCSYDCKLSGNTASCYCISGYELDSDLQTCKDIDECAADATNLCSIKSTCTNIAGSFQCSCPTGKFLENDQRTCTDCDQFHWGDSCNNTCDCGPGASSCNPVAGCVCMSGWQSDKCDADIDECNAVNNPCDTANNQKCVNTAGSYICQCVTGYQNVSGTCTNIDECGTNNPCDQLCTDTPGSYTCACRAGFTMDANQKCQDINECDSSLDKCDQICINKLGSYKCSCNDGYQLDKSDLRTCAVKTECSQLSCTTGTCAVNNQGLEYCACPNGYNLTMTDNVTGICENIDECVPTNPCGDVCTDTTPGYVCSCSVNGTKLDNDLSTCTACMEGNWGPNCEEICTCISDNTINCNKTDGMCNCKTGWDGSNCEKDINECLNATICQDNSQCQNTNGSYICVCNDGYISYGDVCTECGSNNWGASCAQICLCDMAKTSHCNNVDGNCTCKPGWQGTTCVEDVNECTGNPTICNTIPNSQCNNLNGSHACNCVTGYEKLANGNCQDFIISTEENSMSTMFIDNDESTTFISEENSTFVSEEKSTFVSEEKSTGLSFREKLYYGLLAAGLALVLFLSLLCNVYFCINRKYKKESGLILKESPTIALQILEENVPNGNQRISLVEMDEISVYESINENQMLSNLALAMQSNVRTVRQLKRSQSTSSTTSSEKSYSEIADDNAYLNPYQPMTSDRESSNLHKYSTTSNTEKSLQKPQCDDVDEVTIANKKRSDFVDVQNTSSTLLEADVVNLSDHESSSDDDTDGKGDAYLHPYVPLMTNCIEYLHSYNSPINHDQLMKNNKSLTSSPCDDMDKVPIAEQKTKDSVGKENAMNLSDHESSESDSDTDAMCGNGDGYRHPYVPLTTNCMEYLHSYTSPVINSSLVINSSAIINEDQLMKLKLKENEHCDSVMNVTNDEDYTDGLSPNAISN